MFGVKVFEMLRAIRNFVVGAEGTAGSALIEFALVAPILFVIFTATVEFGLYLYRQMEVQNAAQAGAVYAGVCAASAPDGKSCSYSSSLVSSAMTTATTLGVTTAYNSPTCYCPNGTGTLTLCTGTPPACTGSVTPGYYVQVSATATYSPVTTALFTTKASYTLTASAFVRIQ